MNNAAKAEVPKEKVSENRKPQNPESLRSQEQKVTHDKVSRLKLLVHYLFVINERRFTSRKTCSVISRPVLFNR